MLILTKSVLASLIGFLLALSLALILIPLLKRKKADQRLSIYLEETHRSKKNTPTMGGLIFIFSTIVTIIMLYLTNKIELSYNFIIVIFTFLSYALIGFMDDYLIIKRNNNKGLTEGEKLISQIIVAIIFFYLFLKADNEPLLWIHSLHLKLNIGWFYGLFILFVLVASSNAVNLTDGLDGLAGGLSVISITTFGIILYNTGWLEGYEEIAIFCFILVGGILGFLVFNTNPAKIFMGDTGSLSLGATMAIIAVLTSHEVTFIILALVFIIETLASIIQMASIMIRHKKVFLMTPLHHHYEKLGYNERDIVKTFWVVGIMLAMAGVLFAVWL